MPEHYDNDFDVKTEADKMLLALSFLAELNLEGIVEVVNDAHSLAPMLDPTRYRDALRRGDMDAVRDIAAALRSPLRMYRAAIAGKVPA